MIRFACPGCKSVLASKDEQIGKVVMCPKCRQRMQVPRRPREPKVEQRTASKKTTKSSRRALVAAIALLGVFFLACVCGAIWLKMGFLGREPEPILAERETPPASSKSSIDSMEPADKKSTQDQDSKTASPSKPSQPTERPKAQGIDVPRSESDSEKPKPPAEEKKEIKLAEDLPPELPFDLVDTINVHRAKAGVEPIFLDPEASRACQSRAESFARHAGQPRPPKAEQGSKGAETERTEWTEQAPLTAIEKWLKEPARRAAILEPRLRTFGAGFARNVDGQWFSVFDWTHGLDVEPTPQALPVAGAIAYPAPGQLRVPLWFPGNETPDPLPQTKDKLAGFPITLIFPSQAQVKNVTAKLSVKTEEEIALWLSTPEKPANPRFVGSQQNTICLIAKQPLRPNTRYHIEASATVSGAAWSAKWDFTTMSEGEIHQEMAGPFVRILNGLRRRAGLPPAPLDAERSKACFAHAHYLGRNVLNNPTLNWNQEKADLPGYKAEGAALAPRASIQGGGGPSEAVMGLVDSLISRPQLLDPRLHDLGLGYMPFVLGGWLWVVDFHPAAGRDTDKEYFYPAPDQENVPLIYPPNEVPSPIPDEHKGKQAGYAITALFGPRTRVKEATAKLVDDKGTETDGWLSTPEKPAIDGFRQHSLCFLPKAPLRPDTRYTATLQAEVNDRPWQRIWSFATLKEPDRYSDDIDEKITAQVNTVRKAAGLRPVRLDAELSRGCQEHARYLALNQHSKAIQGMGMHRQEAGLPGASPQGARAAKEAVIAIVLDPQMCVGNWMATLYHRIPILAPNLERIGFGHVRVQGHKWVCVLDTGNGRAPRDR